MINLKTDSDIAIALSYLFLDPIGNLSVGSEFMNRDLEIV